MNAINDLLHSAATQPLRTRLMHCLVAFAVYALALPPLHAIADRAAVGFTLIPVILTANAFGMRGGVGSGVMSIFLNVSLILLIEQAPLSSFERNNFWAAHVVFIFVGAAMGVLRNIRIDLHESQEHYRQLADAAFEGIFITHQGRIIKANEQIATMLGYEVEELLGKRVLELIPEDFHDAVRAHAQDLEPYDGMGIRKDGSTLPVEVKTRAVTMGGQLVYIAAISDISEREEAQKRHTELAIAESRVQLLNRLVQDISHDLRTPVSSVIKTSLYLIGKAPDKQQHYLEQLDEQVAHLTRMVDGLVALSRLSNLTHLDFQPTDLTSLIKKNTAAIHHRLDKNDVQLVLELDDRVPPIQANADELSSALEELLTNAFQYTPAKGTITVRLAAQNGTAIISIQDTGMGISPDDLPHIFDNFYRADKARRTNQGEAGLGLAIAARCIELHGGSITVESTPDVGSTFHVRLPITAPPAHEG